MIPPSTFNLRLNDASAVSTLASKEKTVNFSLFIRTRDAPEDTPSYNIHWGGPGTEEQARQSAWETCAGPRGLRPDRLYFIGGYELDDLAVKGVISVRTWKQLNNTTGKLGPDMGPQQVKINL